MKRRETSSSWLPLLAAAVVIALLLFAALPAAAQQSGERVGEVVWTLGRVTGEPAGGSIGVLAQYEPVLLDMRLRTGSDSGVGFTLEPNALIELGPGSDSRVDRALIDAENRPDGAITVITGYVRIALRSLFGGRFGVAAGAATIGVKGTVFGVRVVDDETATIWAFEALGDDLTVTSRDTGESVVLASGYVTVVAPGAAPTPPIPFDPKTGAAAGIVLPFPPGPPDVFDEPPLPPGDNDLPPDRGNDDAPPGLFGGDGKPNDG